MGTCTKKRGWCGPRRKLVCGFSEQGWPFPTARVRCGPTRATTTKNVNLQKKVRWCRGLRRKPSRPEFRTRTDFVQGQISYKDGFRTRTNFVQGWLSYKDGFRTRTNFVQGQISYRDGFRTMTSASQLVIFLRGGWVCYTSDGARVCEPMRRASRSAPRGCHTQPCFPTSSTAFAPRARVGPPPPPRLRRRSPPHPKPPNHDVESRLRMG